MLFCQYIMAIFSTACGSQHDRWPFAMTINVTRHAPKLSLRGAFWATRQSTCALAAKVPGLWIATRPLAVRDDGPGLSLRREILISTRQSMCALAA